MNKERPLVLVTTSFPISGDGSEAAGSFVADFVEELAKTREVRVVAPGRSARREQWSDRVEVFRFASPEQALSTLKPWRPRDLLWLFRVLRGGMASTRAAITDGSVTHILALWGLPCGEWARRAALEMGIGYSVWLLGSDVWTLGKVPYVRGRLARVMRQAEAVYADGYKLAKDGQKLSGVPVQFLPSTRRIDLLDPPPPRCAPPYRLLFLGRWHPNKGVDILLDALALLDEDDWQLIERVDIQGGGPLDALVRERVNVLRTVGRPVEAGRFLVKTEAEAAIAASDWVLIPSRIESIPVVFSDAVKLGRPVVASPVGDLPRLLQADPPCGILAKEATAAALAEALGAALHAPPGRFSEGTTNGAAQFDLQNVSKSLCLDTAGT